MMMVIIIIIITTTLSRAVAVFISCHFLSTLWVPSRYVLQPPPPPPSFSCAKDASPPRLSQIIYCICVYSKRGKKEYINVAHSIYIFICLSSWAMSPQIALSLRGKQRSERVHMCHGETSTVHLVLHCSIWDAILPFFCVSPLRIFRGICRACVCQATLMRAQFPFPRSYVHFSLFFHFFFAVFCCVTFFLFCIQSYRKTLSLVKAESNDAGHRVRHVISATWLASLIVWLWDQKEKAMIYREMKLIKISRKCNMVLTPSLSGFFFSLGQVFSAFVCGCHCCAMNLCRLPLLTGLTGS